jgi:hypothetical protein
MRRWEGGLRRDNLGRDDAPLKPRTSVRIAVMWLKILPAAESTALVVDDDPRAWRGGREV